ncbi:hypothetical protein [Magnetospirillum sp. UT-4]|nr:hypothetical protein [Magnetospirillum sp. UT-4]CAA7622758.1 hypothetical protein MTBUT4_440010 [Magnetospirillum sp. UT-4]
MADRLVGFAPQLVDGGGDDGPLLKAGTGCGSCVAELKALLAQDTVAA